MSKFDIAKCHANLIQKTQDPLAAIKLQNCATNASALGKMLAATASKETVNLINNKLLSAWPGDEIELIAGTPEFLVALTSILYQSCIEFAVKTAKEDLVSA